MPSIDLDAVRDAADTLFAADAAHGCSLALVVRHHDAVVFERYGRQPDTVFGPGGPVDVDTPLLSWSMAKSITHALVGLIVGDGLLDPEAPAAVPSWQGTAKEPITLLDLLEMKPGLEFVEDYVDERVSHCLEMLFGSGRDDMAEYAASLPLVHQPGIWWNYSSGTTNIVARIAGDAIGGGRDGMDAYLQTRLFEPIGMMSATPSFDAAGTFVGSTFVHATARDFSRFGQLYLDDGTCCGERILPAGWRDHARTFSAHDPDGEFDYGRQWWLWPEFPGSLGCHGYEGQYTVVAPDRDLVVVHLGKSPIAQRPPLLEQLRLIIGSADPG